MYVQKVKDKKSNLPNQNNKIDFLQTNKKDDLTPNKT